MRTREAARCAGVSPTTIQKWISHCKTEGENGLQDRNKDQRSYSEEIKEKAVVDYLSEAGSLLTIASRYNIRPENLLHRWIRAYVWLEHLSPSYHGLRLTARKEVKYNYNSTSRDENRHYLPAKFHHLQGARPFQWHHPRHTSRQNLSFSSNMDRDKRHWLWYNEYATASWLKRVRRERKADDAGEDHSIIRKLVPWWMSKSGIAIRYLLLRIKIGKQLSSLCHF